MGYNYEIMQKNNVLIPLFLILVVTAIIYLPSLNNGFVYWDDPLYVVNNTLIKHMNPSAIMKMFGSFHYGAYKPLTMLSLALDHHFFKLDPFGYHLTNVLLHLFNVVLVFWFIFLITDKAAVAFITTLLFALHPLRVESVVWIAERKDCLYAFFYLQALIYYFLHLKKNLQRYYWLSLSCFLFSLLSKPMGLTLPFVLLLLDFLRNKKIGLSDLKNKLPFLIVLSAVIFVNVIAHRLSPEKQNLQATGFPDNILMSSYAMIFYLKKIFWPFKLSCLYLYPQRAGLFLSGYIACFLLNIALFALLARARRSLKILFGAGFFFLTLAPVLPFAIMSSVTVSDRYTYIPSIGLFYLLGEGFVRLYDKHKAFAWRAALIATLSAIALLLSLLTFERTKVWKDDLTLWGNVLKNYPAMSAAHLNLGNYYLDKGDYDNAFIHAEKAQLLNPGSWDSYLLLGNVFYGKNDWDKAIYFYDEAAKANPAQGKIYNNLGVAYYKKGRPEWNRAIDYYRQALVLDPAYFSAFYNLGVLYESAGMKKEALEYFDRALALDPVSLEVLWHLADFYIENRSAGKALEIFERMIKMHPSDTALLARIRSALGTLKNTVEKSQ